jgi:hypothetical protein
VNVRWRHTHNVYDFIDKFFSQQYKSRYQLHFFQFCAGVIALVTLTVYKSFPWSAM